VVVVSHDRHLLGLVADRLVLVDGGGAKELAGSLDDYRDMILGSGRGKSGDGEAPARRESRKDERRNAAELRECSKSLRKAVAQAEAELTDLLSRPQSAGDASISELMKTRAEVEREVASAEHRWLEASEAAERASEVAERASEDVRAGS
jgi:ATP-binding cassette subfamily F protein 3